MSVSEIVSAAVDGENTALVDLGVYRGVPWVVVWQDGWFCGYLKGFDAEPSPWIHGGWTYGPDEDGWVGFDTNHAGDVNRYQGDHYMPAGTFTEETLWDLNEIHDELLFAIDEIRT